MKKLSLLSAVLGLSLMGSANANETITIYYSPTCPYCHYARNDISGGLIYEYPNISVTEIDVSKPENRSLFGFALEKCNLKSGGVPVIVYGDNCKQGYSGLLKDDVRKFLDANLGEEEKALVATNRKAMEEDAEAFKAKNADRKNAVTQYVHTQPENTEEKTAEKPVEQPAESVVESPAEKPVEQPAESVVESPAEQTAEVADAK